MRALLLLLIITPCALAYYVSHTLSFPRIPFSAGVYHIHSPAYFLEAHGFVLPGFKLVESSKPRTVRDYVYSEFVYRTYFGKASARVFSNSLNTSQVLLMDPSGVPCMLGKLSLERCSSRGFVVKAHADLLRPSNVWERMFGGRRRVNRDEVQRSINLGYSDFKNDLNFKCYVNMVFDSAKKSQKPSI
jgi:hypothetical protein